MKKLQKKKNDAVGKKTYIRDSAIRTQKIALTVKP